MSQQQKYLEEYEKYKHITITPGDYCLKDTNIKYRVTLVDEDKNSASLINLSSNNVLTKTLHWCRKYLRKTV